MNRISTLVSCLAIPAAMVLASCSSTGVAQERTTATTNGGKPLIVDAQTLRGAAPRGLLVGTANMSTALDDPNHARLIAEQFSAITPENEMKPESVQKEKGKFTFEGADKIVAFAAAHGIMVNGHTLCWHHQTSAWMYADENGKPLPREQALANLKAHIDAVAGHFKGKVYSWDVVNEAISNEENEYLRDTPALRAIGPDFVIKAFEFAHAADPDAQLYYNEYGNESGFKMEHTIRLLKELKAAGVRLDGVGIQCHWSLVDPDPSEMLEKAIERYNEIGVKVMITELDIDVLPRRMRGAEITATEKANADPYRAGLPPELAQKQAERYAQIYRVVLKHPGVVTRVTTWGSHDGTSWLNTFPTAGRMNYPLLFDRELKPKPAFFAVLKEMQAAKK